jgi:hypothetical protein
MAVRTFTRTVRMEVGDCGLILGGDGAGDGLGPWPLSGSELGSAPRGVI